MAACATAPPPQEPPLENRKPQPAVIADPALEIAIVHEVTCATCPAYVVHVTARGVIWDGVLGVRVTGEQTGPIDKRRFDQIAVTIEMVGLFEHDPEPNPACGPPTVRLKVRRGEQLEERAFDPQCERALRTLVDQIEDAAGVATWR